MSWKRYRVTLTRMVEEECQIFITAADALTATELAVEQAEEVADLVWLRSDCEPHTYGVDKIEDAESIQKGELNEA